MFLKIKNTQVKQVKKENNEHETYSIDSVTDWV